MLRSVGDAEIPRAAHTATLLRDGRVLLAGGCTAHGCEDSERGRRSEFFEPERGIFVAGPEMGSPRTGHTATRLPDGDVLIIGGWPGEGRDPLSSAEIFDPGSGAFRPTGSMAEGRGGHVAASLPDGRVMITGGTGPGGRILGSAEVYDPRTGRFAPAPAATPRTGGTAVTLRDGRIFVVGGDPVSTMAEIFDPDAFRWRVTGRMETARRKLGAAVTEDGAVLVAGGSVPGDGDRDNLLNVAELYSPATGRFRELPPMIEPRYKIDGSLVPLTDGRILIAGGARIPEIYNGRFHPVAGSLDAARLVGTATILRDGRVLITGGYDEDITPRAAAYLFVPRA
ncbi:hypothetical protein Aple_091430 [Acrocarpospora pleiomorpha]|uniref:Galactose oxidase n=1 Tax=Acrocarpospora pleiomorpha TaxID=90975 RepID=A0A5M3XYP2_9ACTN|nr:kelch repeat-containing protein [Acrocarpospora pleiomorpha]GES26244.1 hypothetical protein Aple_091430 [Acrocarpospora pleiomorpha]